MKLSKLVVLLIFLSFHDIYNEKTEIKNFEEISIKKGTNEYFYQFSNPIVQDEKDAYFFFKFSYDYKLELKIIDEDQEITSIKVNTKNEYICYNITNLKPQNYTFIVINNNNYAQTMFFVDNSREINLNLEKFLDFSFNTEYISRRPPLPLIFNIEEVSEGLYVHFGKYSYTIYDGNYTLEYCILEGNECNFSQDSQFLEFIKGKRYKIKVNCNENDANEYFFKKWSISAIIKEVGLGGSYYLTNEKIKDAYFIINVKNYEYIYTYIDTNYYYFYYDFLTENEKISFTHSLDNFDSRSGYKKELTTLECENDYLVIKIEYYSSPYKALINIFSAKYRFESLEQSFEIEKGICALITKERDFYGEKYFLVSSNRNMAFFDSGFNPLDLTNILELDRDENKIYIDSSKEKSIFKIYTNSINTNSKFNLITEKNLNDFFNKTNTDFMFLRINSYSLDFSFNSTYLFGLDEKYYLYNKIHYGNIDFYQYNGELNALSNISELQNPFDTYKNPNEYELINNKFLNISGYKLFTFLNTYGSLYDVYIQKVNDLEYIKMNSNMFPYNNLVKLFEPNKKYYLDFTVNHLIKLDNKFLEASVTFIDKNGEKYILNKNKRVIKDLKGDNITLETNQNALIYFYLKMDDNTELGMIEFNKSQTGKIMKFNITNIIANNIRLYIAKDFGFKGYYPMINKGCWDNINLYYNNSISIYVENLYDKVDNEVYENEGEKYYVYIFSPYYSTIPTFDPNNYNISSPIYIDNLLNPKSKYNFEIIPANPKGFVLLNSNKQIVSYQLMTCESKEIQFKIENSFGFFNSYSYTQYPYEVTINQTKKIDFYLSGSSEILVHSFKSNNEFLFLYSTSNNNNGCSKNNAFSIIAINKIFNKIQIKFNPVYKNCLNYYYIIIAKKDENNNYDSFSNPCYLSRIFTQNSNTFFIKKTLEETNKNSDLIIVDIDENEFNFNKNDELICTIINYNNFGNQLLEFYTPIEFQIESQDATEFKLGEEVVFNFKDKNFFKFEYIYENGNSGDIYFYFEISYPIELFLIDEEKTQVFDFTSGSVDLFKLTLKKSGIYYLNFYSMYSNYLKKDSTFIAFASGSIIDTIDLTKRMYHLSSKIKTLKKYQANIIKVKNLKEDKYVFFSYKVESAWRDEIFHNPFEICNDINNKCTKNVTLYQFLQGNEYSIYINYINKAEDDYYDNNYFYYPSYIIVPLFSDIFEEKEEGYYTISTPKIFIINLKNKGILYSMYDNIEKVYEASSNKKINQDNINSLEFKEDRLSSEAFSEEEGYNYKILFIIPSIKDNNGRVIIFNELIYSKFGKYTIKENKNAIFIFNKIAYEDDYNIKIPLESYNILSTISSPIENLKVIYLNNSKSYNYYIQNYIPIPIYVEKNEKSIDLEFKIYPPRYAFFIGANNNLIKAFMTLANSYIPSSIQLSSNQLFPFNLRINSDSNDFYDFFNFYFYKCESKVNIFIKKFYGETDFYECDADSIDKNDLNILTKPITSCKNKKSIFNRIITLDGTKLLSGYLDYNSYLDIYVEIDDEEDTNISISKLIESYSGSHSSKYLKKGVEYTLTFTANHLIKLEPGFDAEVSIYKNKEIIAKLNSTNPISIIKGDNLKIQSNNEAMIYFYCELMNGLKQTKIEPQKGKNIEIQITKGRLFVIDFGFEGYNFMNILSLAKSRTQNNGTIYLENPYDKLKTKLVDGEFLYLYTQNVLSDNIISITYHNIKNPKNEYTFHFIKNNTNNEEEKTLIINNEDKDYIIYHINFCSSPHPIKMFYQFPGFDEDLFEFGKENQIFNQSIPHNSIKLRFESLNDFIFTYSFIDKTDLIFNNYEKWKKERVVNDKLNIEDIYKKKNNGNMITIKFNPNYRYSSTKYIIVIALKNDNNSLQNFTNPCYIVQLVTEKSEGIKVFNIYDIGESSMIKADIDIPEILNETNEYIINIISQELRFEKKLNYYSPITFIPKNLVYKEEKDENNEDGNENENENGINKNDENNNTLLYIFIPLGVILIIIILIIIICCIKRKRNNIDFYKEANTLKNENLLNNM